MKAKHFAKIRSKVKYYQVDTSDMLFGRFDIKFKGERVLAYSYQNACDRYNKRHHRNKGNIRETDECWAYYRVKLLNKIAHPRHYKFFY